MTELTEAQREKRRQQARDAIEKGLRDSHHIWHQTPSRLDWAADAALDALGDLAAEILADGTMMRALTVKDGVASLELEPATDILKIFVASCRGLLDGHGAQNYLETEMVNTAPSLSMDLRDGDNPAESYTVTIQRRTRPTPHEFRQRAEATVQRVTDLCASHYAARTAVPVAELVTALGLDEDALADEPSCPAGLLPLGSDPVEPCVIRSRHDRHQTAAGETWTATAEDVTP